MSDVEYEKKYCNETGKVCYSQAEAGKVITKFKTYKRIRNNKTIPQRSYLCQFCGCYHLTHYRQKTSTRKFSGERLKKL